MSLLGLVPTGWLWGAAGLAGAALAGALGVQTLRLEHARRDAAEMQAAWAADRQRAEFAAREIEHAAAVAVKGANDAKDRELARVRAAAADTRGELGRLRDALAAAGGGAAPQDAAALVGLDDAARARAVVGECAQSLAALAETADACEARVTGLQGYILAITPAPEP